MELPRIPYSEKRKHLVPHQLGYLTATIAAVLFGLIHTVSKPLISSASPTSVEINPVVLSCIIYLIIGLFFTPVTRNTAPIKNINKKDLLVVAMVGVAEVIALITYFIGLKTSTAVNASILTNGEIIFSILITMTIFRERLQQREIIPFMLIVVGIALLPVANDLYQNGMVLNELVFGDLLILLSGLFYAIDINLSRYVTSKMDARRITQLGSFSAATIALGAVAIFQIPFEVSLSQIPSIVIIGIFGIGIATFFFYTSLKLIGAIRTVLIYSTSTIFGMIFAAVFLHEIIFISNMASIALVSIGMYLLRNRVGQNIILGKSTETRQK